MAQQLNGLRVAILVADGFEQVEMVEPRKALDAEGATTSIVSPANGRVQGVNHDEKADTFAIDAALDDAKPDDFDALLLPGGAMNPDELRTLPKAVAFVRAFIDGRKPIAAICHAPWLLVEADVLNGRTLTSWPSLRTDIANAGGLWVDKSVVEDGNLITSRNPDDIPNFIQATIRLFALKQPANA